MNTNTGETKMTNKYHENDYINFHVDYFLTNKEFVSKYLNADMFKNDRIINALQAVFGLSKSNAKIVADIVFKEFYYGSGQ